MWKSSFMAVIRGKCILEICFRDFLPINLLMILALVLPVSWIVTKFPFIGVILEDTIALHGKNNLKHLHISTKNWYINWDNFRRYHCIGLGKKLWNSCICQPVTDTFIEIRVFPKVYYRKFSYVQRILTVT